MFFIWVTVPGLMSAVLLSYVFVLLRSSFVWWVKSTESGEKPWVHFEPSLAGCVTSDNEAVFLSPNFIMYKVWAIYSLLHRIVRTKWNSTHRIPRTVPGPWQAPNKQLAVSTTITVTMNANSWYYVLPSKRTKIFFFLLKGNF
jgi:hypothetical protein